MRLGKKGDIERLRQQNRDLYWTEAGKGAMRDLQQTFAHPWAYITELLQNAVDEGATIVDCHVEEGSLVFEHSGNEFIWEDVGAICRRGVSRKGVGTIGFMGIGFKSVFRSFQTVAISSDGWRFRLTVSERKGDLGEIRRDWRESTLPVWDESLPDPGKGMRCRFSLSDRVTGLDSVETDLSRVMGEDQILLVTLALKGVQELTWNGETWRLSVEDHGHSSPGIGRTVVKASKYPDRNSRRWMVLSSTYKPRMEASRKLLEHRQPLWDTDEERRRIYEDAMSQRVVQAICPLDDNGAPLPPKHGAAYATLPVGLSLPLGMHIQADWLLSISRTSLIDATNNPWHDDIVNQIPGLLTEFLLWIVADGSRREGWNSCYRVLPQGWEDPSYRWFLNDSFTKTLRATLEVAPILPAVGHNGMPRFIAPMVSRVLPEAFSDLDGEQGHYAFLLGDNVVSRRLLTEAGLDAFRGLSLVNDLGPEHVSRACDNGGVRHWLSTFNPDEQQQMLVRFLACLARADKQSEWAASNPACLPTENGTWIGRRSAVVLPAEWVATLAVEPRIQSMLKRYVGSEDTLVSEDLTLLARTWSAEPAIRTARQGASAYLLTARKSELPDVVDRWWQSMETKAIEESTRSDVIYFTCWVKRSQDRWKSRLITRLLTKNEDGVERLLPAGKTLIAEPYAASYRVRFFPEVPRVSDSYLTLDPQHGSASNWRTFFEGLTPSPKGRLQLRITTALHRFDDEWDYAFRFWWYGNPPGVRKTDGTASWRGKQLSNRMYGTLDAGMPDEWVAVAQHGKPGPELAQWMAEGITTCEDYLAPRIAFIPANKAECEEYSHTHHRSNWCKQARDLHWIVSRDQRGPFRPAEVLPRQDPARPDAPVAQLPEQLIRLLDAAGVKFGTDIHQVTAVERLALEGPTATDSRLKNLVDAAIAECRDNRDGEARLRNVLGTNALLPAVAGTRVTHGRVVKTRVRGDLGGWLVPVDHFDASSEQRAVLNSVDGFWYFPSAATGHQAVSFLKGLWSRSPAPTKGMSALAEAFDLMRVDWDSGVEDIWNTVSSISRVPLLPDGRWSEPSQGDMFYRDSDEFIELVNDLDVIVVDERSLGTSRPTQDFVAQLLGITRLSDRFSVNVCCDQVNPLPQIMSTHLQAVCDVVAEALADRAGGEVGQFIKPTFTCPEVVIACDLHVVLIDRSGHETIRPVTSTAYEGARQVFLTSADPFDFAADLARLLIKRWDLEGSGRDLGMHLALCLSQIASSSGIEKPLRAMRKAFGVPEPEPATISPIASLSRGSQQQEQKTGTEAKTNAVAEDETGQVNGPSQMTYERRPENPGSFTIRDRARTAGAGPLQRLSAIERPASEHQLSETTIDEMADREYREATVKYESLFGRSAVMCPERQPGYDIESSQDGRLCRRIEVKGKGVPWERDELVRVSRTQFEAASRIDPDAGYDYWVYVVSREQDGWRVMPLRNPSRLVYYHDLTADLWRSKCEQDLLIRREDDLSSGPPMKG